MAFDPPTPPAGKPQWPAMFTHPSELLQWLNKQRPADKAGQKAVVTLRWLVFGELERCVPDPPPQAITHFTPEEPGVQLNMRNDLTSGQQ